MNHSTRVRNWLERRLAERVPISERRASEAGDTLLEILLALIVLGLASLALIIAFSTTISASAEHRRLATADIVLNSLSQQAVSNISSTLSLFQSCPIPLSTYTTDANLSIPAIYSNQYTQKITQVLYWSASQAQFTSTCVKGAPQEITIAVTDANGHTYLNSFVVNYPLANSNQTTNAGPADHLIFAAQPGSTNSSGVPFDTQPTVEIVDANGNVVTTDLSPVTLTIYSGTSGAVLSGCTGNELSGVVYFTGCAINTAGTYVLQASDGTLGTALTTPFNVSGTAPYIKFTTQPKAAASGSAFTTQPALAVYSGSSVDSTWSGTISLTTSGGIMSCAGLTPDKFGAFSVTVTKGVGATLNCTFMGGFLYDPISNVTLAIPYTMTATASGLIPATSSAFSVTGPGPASQMRFSQQPSGVSSNSASAVWPTQPIVTFADAFGNVATTSSNAVSLSMNGSGSLQGCTSSTYKGVVTFSGCHGTAYGSGYQLTATSSGLPNANSATFNITGLAASLVFTTQPVAGVSGGTLPTQPVITIYDAGGLVVTASTTPITLTTSGGVLQYCTGLTPVNGVVAVSTCTFAGLIGTPYTMTATQGLLSAVSAPFSPTDPGLPTQLVYTTTPVAGAAGSALTTQPIVKIEDSAGNVVTSSSYVISLSASGGTFSSCSNLMAVNGVVNVSGCTFGGVVGSPYTLTASASGLTSATSVISPTAPGPIANIVATSGSGQSATVTTTFTSPLVATVTDNWTNPISGATVTFSVPGTGASASFTGGVFTETTGANGAATTPTFSANQIAGSYAITASAGSSFSVPFSETNTAQRTNDTMTIVQGNGQSTTVGTPFGTNLEVQILDQYGNPVGAMPVTFTAPASGQSASFAACTSNPSAYVCTTSTDAFGNASASLLTANHLVGTYGVTTSASGVSNPSTFTLTNLVGSATQVLISATPNANTASSSTNVTLGLQLADQYGNPTTSASATSLTLSTNSSRGFFNGVLGGSGSLGAPTTVVIPAGGTGATTITYGDENAGSPTITAKNGSSTWGTVSLTINAGAPWSIAATSGSGQVGRAGQDFTNPLVATVFDQFNNPVPNVLVTFTGPASGASSNFAGAATTTATSGSNGQATSGTFTANHVTGTYAIVASAGALSANFSESNIAGVPAVISVISGSGQSAVVGTAFTNPLVVYVTDAWGNPVSGATVTFSPPNGSTATANFNGSVVTATTGVNGRATSAGFSANNTAGVNYQIGASASGTNTVNFLETNTAGPATQVMISPAPNPGAASTTTDVALTVQLLDQYGNPTTSSSSTLLNFTTSSSGGYFNLLNSSGGGGASLTIAANGTGSGTIYYGDTKANMSLGWLITAKNGTSTWGTTHVQITGGAAKNIAVSSGSGQAATTGAQFTNSLVAYVTDNWGNPVTGALVTFTPPASGASATFAGGTNTATTDSSGLATSAAFSANATSGGPYYIVASSPGTGTANFSETNNAGYRVKITPNPTSMTAINQSNMKLTLQITNSAGTSNIGIALNLALSSSSGQGFFTTGSGRGTGSSITSITTNSSGTATVYYGDTLAGTPTISAINGSTTGTSTVTITAGSAKYVEMVPFANTLTINSYSYLYMNAQLVDQYLNPTTNTTGNTISLYVYSDQSGFFDDGQGGSNYIRVRFPSGNGMQPVGFFDYNSETSNILFTSSSNSANNQSSTANWSPTIGGQNTSGTVQSQ